MVGRADQSIYTVGKGKISKYFWAERSADFRSWDKSVDGVSI